MNKVDRYLPPTQWRVQRIKWQNGQPRRPTRGKLWRQNIYVNSNGLRAWWRMPPPGYTDSVQAPSTRFGRGIPHRGFPDANNTDRARNHKRELVGGRILHLEIVYVGTCRH